MEYGSVALYEYLGNFPNTVAEHGIAKKSAREYVRTHVDVLGKIKQNLVLLHYLTTILERSMLLSTYIRARYWMAIATNNNHCGCGC